MSVRSRLILTYAALILLLAVPSVYAASRLGRLRRLAVEGRSGEAVAVATLGSMQARMAELDRLERSFIATDDARLGREASATADSLRAAYERFTGTPYGDLAADLGPIVGDFGALTTDIGRHMDLGQVDAATASLDRMLSDIAGAGSQIDLLADSIDALSQRDLAQAEEISRSARIQTLVGVLIAILLTGTLAGFMTHMLTTPIRRLGRAMARVADGTIEAPSDLPYRRRDEIGELSSSFQSMTRRLAELDRTKSEFLGMVSHELKTPINVISAYTELIEDAMAGPDVDESQRSLLHNVREQAAAMTRLVSRLMDLSRLEAGTYRLVPERVRVEDLLLDVERAYARLARERRIGLRTRISQGAPETIVVDFDIMREEVLGNLVLNALRYAGTGGWVSVEVDGNERGITFTVTDSGPGVPDEHRELIFRKYYSADRTRAVGSGLGLAIAKEMVELHGGLIALESSAPSAGARFKVALPLGPGCADVEVPDRALIDQMAELVAPLDA